MGTLLFHESLLGRTPPCNKHVRLEPPLEDVIATAPRGHEASLPMRQFQREYLEIANHAIFNFSSFRSMHNFLNFIERFLESCNSNPFRKEMNGAKFHLLLCTQ